MTKDQRSRVMSRIAAMKKFAREIDKLAIECSERELWCRMSEDIKRDLDLFYKRIKLIKPS